MPAWILIAAAALSAIGAVATAATGETPLVPIGLAALGCLFVLALITRWRPERLTLFVVVVIVATGLGAAAVRVIDGVADGRIDFTGSLDVNQINTAFHPEEAAGGGPINPDQGRLTEASGETTIYEPDSDVLAVWSIGELVPWLLAGVILALLLPILTAAIRGEPFLDGASRRLWAIGTLLLIGIPAIVFLEFGVASLASRGQAALAPDSVPEFSIALADLLPGLLVLVLAGVFRRGIELQDLERHTI